MAQTVKTLPAVQETRLLTLGQKDALEEGMATHSSILAWRIPWMEEPARLLCPWGSPGKDSGVSCRLLLQGIFLS